MDGIGRTENGDRLMSANRFGLGLFCCIYCFCVLTGCVSYRQQLVDAIENEDWHVARGIVASDPTLANVQLPNTAGSCLLHLLVSSGARPEFVTYAVLQGADPLKCDAYGDTALHVAAQRGEMAAVVALLDSGCPPDPRSRRYAHTPLMRAVMTGHCGIARELLERGADPNAMCNTGRTPLAYAVGPFSQQGACVETLLEAGADPKRVDAQGNSLEEYMTNEQDLRDDQYE